MMQAGLPPWLPYCGAAPSPDGLMERWNLDPWLLLAMLALPLLFRTTLKQGGRRRHAFIGGWLIAALLFVSPFCALTSALFAARTVHHLVLVGVLAPIIAVVVPRAFRAPGGLALWASAHALIFWAWHAPELYAAALSSHALYWVMQASLLLSAIMLWLKLRAAEPLVAVAALLATMVQMGLLGALLTFSRAPLYAPHFGSAGAWGLAPLEDQQLAGLIMWAPGAGLYLLAAAAILARWLARAQAAEAA
jgi:putative membrane protein